MSDDMKAKIVLEGDASGATAALSDFQSTMKQSFNSIQDSLDALGEGFGKIGAMLGAVTAAIAGGDRLRSGGGRCAGHDEPGDERCRLLDRSHILCAGGFAGAVAGGAQGVWLGARPPAQ